MGNVQLGETDVFVVVELDSVVVKLDSVLELGTVLEIAYMFVS